MTDTVTFAKSYAVKAGKVRGLIDAASTPSARPSAAQTRDLTEAILELNGNEIADVIAIAWIGRGDFDPKEWALARMLAAECATMRSGDYVARMRHLARNLDSGLKHLTPGIDG